MNQTAPGRAPEQGACSGDIQAECQLKSAREAAAEVPILETRLKELSEQENHVEAWQQAVKRGRLLAMTPPCTGSCAKGCPRLRSGPECCRSWSRPKRPWLKRCNRQELQVRQEGAASGIRCRHRHLDAIERIAADSGGGSYLVRHQATVKGDPGAGAGCSCAAGTVQTS